MIYDKYIPLTHIAVTIFLLGLAGCSSKKEDTGGIELKDIKLSSLDGKSIYMDEFQDKTVFINFWATWCGPCIQEMPTIERAQGEMNGKDVVFLLASNEDFNQIERFSKKHDFKFRYVKLENMEELNIAALPTTFIFDSDGTLKFSETGYRMWDEPANLELISKIANDKE